MTRLRVLLMVGVWGLLVLALVASDAHPATFVLGGAVAAVCTGAFAALDIAGSMVEVEWSRRSRRALPARRHDPRVSSLRRKVQGSWWSGTSEIGDTLVELVDDRLLAHHHIDRATDPASAMAVLTPGLRTLVTTPLRRTVSPRELQSLLTEIEAL